MHLEHTGCEGVQLEMAKLMMSSAQITQVVAAGVAGVEVTLLLLLFFLFSLILDAGVSAA